MKLLYPIFLSITLLFINCNNNEKKIIPPKAFQGLLDLRNWDFTPSENHDGIISLDGEWEFYWNEFIDHSCEIDASQSNIITSLEKSKLPISNKNCKENCPCGTNESKRYISVPSEWNNHGYPSNGYASYKLKVLLPEQKEGTDKNLALKIPSISTSYNLYIENTLLSAEGKIGKKIDSSKPFIREKYIPLNDLSFYNEFTIILHLTNFHLIGGGPWESFLLGNNNKINSLFKNNIYFHLIIFSSFLIMGLYHLGLYLSRPKDKSPLFFGLYSILLALRTMSINERLIYDFTDIFSFEVIHKVEYFSFYFGSYLFIQFTRSLFKDEFSNIWLISYSIIYLPSSLLVIFSPIEYYNKSLIFIQISTLIGIFHVLYVTTKSIINKKNGAILFITGFGIFGLTIIHDILKGMGFLYSPDLTSYGFLTFVLFQAIILSRRFAKGFEMAEVLTEDLIIKTQRLEETSFELKSFSENLETKIQERTKELEATKNEIESFNQFSKLINSLSNLDQIFEALSKYAYENYKIVGTWLMLPDETNTFMYTHKAKSYEDMTKEQYNYLLNKKIPLKENEGGILFVSYQRKKNLYLPKIPSFEFEIDKEIGSTLSLKSLVHIPLLRKEECIGIIAFSNLHNEMKLPKKSINHLSNLCSQIAGVIYTHHLLILVENTKKDIDKLNKISRKINNVTDLNDVMNYVMLYIEKEFKINEFWFLVKSNSDNLETHSFVSPYVDMEIVKNLKENPINLKDESIIQSLYFNQKVDYQSIDLEKISSSDQIYLNWNKFSYYLCVPFVVFDVVHALLILHSTKEIEITDDLKEKLQNFSFQISGAVVNSRLYKEVQEEKIRAEEAKLQAEVEKGIAQIAQLESEKARRETELEKEKSEQLLLNILPKDVADELKEKGSTKPVVFESVSVMFTDFKGFTQIAENMTPSELVKELDGCFVQFDKIIERYNLEKLKTIGDSYMCSGGIPKKNNTHPIDIVLAALEIQAFMNQMKEIKEMMGFPFWELRLGIHSGSIVAGVIGEKKFAYDVWGDTVNTASRMESSGIPGMINISGATYNLIKDFFECEYRGKVNAKNKGEVDMYYVHRIINEFSKDENGRVPNDTFWETYNILKEN